MASPFKMQPKTPMMKALVGKQGNLPQHLQDKIKAAPETATKGSPAKSYGSKSKSPMMKTSKPSDKSRSTVGRGGKDVVLSEKDDVVSRRDNKNSGKRDFEQVTQTVEKGSNAPVGTTMADRQGGGRKATKTYQRAKGQKGAYAMTGSAVEGSEVKGGRSQYRDASDTGTKDSKTGKRTYKSQGSTAGKDRVLIEARRVKGPKSKGVVKQKITTAEISRKNLGVRKKEKTASQIKAKGATTSGKPSASAADLKKKETKGKAPVKSYGSKKKSPMMKKGVKGLKMQRGKK
jgi:hypothetical protein